MPDDFVKLDEMASVGRELIDMPAVNGVTGEEHRRKRNSVAMKGKFRLPDAF